VDKLDDSQYLMAAGFSAYVFLGVASTLLTILFKPGAHFLRPLVSSSYIQVDFDSVFFLLIYFPLVTALNIVHTYIMYSWSKSWAELSEVLLMLTALHYLQSFFSIMLVYDEGYYLFQQKDIRWISLIMAYVNLTIFMAIFIAVSYLVFFNQDLIGIAFSLFFSYFLIISCTNIPANAVIIVKEATLSLLSRDDEYSVPGEYFSMFEYWSEELGYYGDDFRLHDYLKNALSDFIEASGLAALAEKLLIAKYLEEYLKKQFRPRYKYSDWFDDTWLWFKLSIEYIFAFDYVTKDEVE
jgi:hypothetical protein